MGDGSDHLLGVLGDTHGRAAACRAGVELLQSLGCLHLVHTGDVGDGDAGRAVLDQLAGTGCRFVWGNNDFDGDRLAPYAADLGLTLLEPFGTFALASRTICVAHGDDLRRLRNLLATARGHAQDAPDLLLTGHSHLAHDERAGPMRWVNPGALFRAATKTVATIDLSRLDEPQAVVHHEIKVS